MCETTDPKLTSILTTLSMMGVPRTYRLSDPKPEYESGIYLYGKSGRGKTTMACGALRSYVERSTIELEGMAFYRGEKCQFVSVPMWFDQMRDAYNVRGLSSMDVFRRYADAHILVLDDLGKGQQTQWTTEKLYMLVDYRCGEGLPTIVTSNYGLKEVSSLLDGDETMAQAIASRLYQTCGKRGLEVKGKDWRLANM